MRVVNIVILCLGLGFSTSAFAFHWKHCTTPNNQVTADLFFDAGEFLLSGTLAYDAKTVASSSLDPSFDYFVGRGTEVVLPFTSGEKIVFSPNGAIATPFDTQGNSLGIFICK